MRCCDNCHPDEFPIDTIVIEGERLLKTGRTVTIMEEVYDAVSEALRSLRQEISQTDFAGQVLITGRSILPDNVIQVLAQRAPLLASVDSIRTTHIGFIGTGMGQGYSM